MIYEMTIEEVWKHITVLKNKNTESGLYYLSLIFLIYAFGPIAIILSSMVGFNIDCFRGITLVEVSAIFLIPAIISFIVYFHRPKKIKMYIITDSYISAKHLAKFFKLSKVEQSDGIIKCNIKPKNKYYAVVNLLQEESEIE